MKLIIGLILVSVVWIILSLVIDRIQSRAYQEGFAAGWKSKTEVSERKASA